MISVALVASIALPLLWAQEIDNSIPAENALYQDAVRTVNEQLSIARQNPTRYWKGASGGAFEGTYLRQENQGKQVVFRDMNQRELTISLQKLATQHDSYFTSRKLLDTGEILPFLLPNQNHTNRRTVDGLKPQPEQVNRTIPKQDLRKKINFASLTEETIVLTLLWWDQNGWLPIPEGKDVTDKARWLSREIKLGDGSVADIHQGLKKYFDKELKDHAVLQFFPTENLRNSLLASEFSLETVKKYAHGTNACLLKLRRYERSKNRGYYYFFVTSIDGDIVTVHYQGENFNLQKKEVLGKKKEVVIEFHFTDMKQVPDWLKQSHFVVDYDWLLCITCHVFSEPGKPVVIPADMPQTDDFQIIAEEPTLPVYAKKMDLIYDKRQMAGRLIAASTKVFWFWQNGGSPRLYDCAKLDPMSSKNVTKWRHEMGQNVDSVGP